MLSEDAWRERVESMLSALELHSRNSEDMLGALTASVAQLISGVARLNDSHTALQHGVSSCAQVGTRRL